MRKYCVITLRSVFVQGIRALDTLSPYIYYELLIIAIAMLEPIVHKYKIYIVSIMINTKWLSIPYSGPGYFFEGKIFTNPQED